MKNFLIFSCMLLMTSSMAVAQERVKFGVMGAFSYSTVTTPDAFQNSNVEDLNWRAGYKIGLTSDIPIAPALSIQPSLLFSSKGYEMMYGNNNANIKLRAVANYMELPILIAFKIPISDNFKFGVHAGPYFAYGVGGKTKIEGAVGSVSGNFDWNTFKGNDGNNYSLSAMDKFDWGISLGAALEMAMLRFSLNYDQGFKALYDTDNSDNNMHNYGIWAGVGIYF